jgi:hypothetical protein
LPLPSPSRVLTTVLGERAGPENSKPMATGHTLGPTLEPHPPSRTGPPGPSSLSRPSIRIARRDATTSVSGTSTAAVTTVPLGYPGMVVPGSGPAPPTAPCGRSGWCGPAWPWEAGYGGSARSAARPALVSRAGTTPCERPVGARQQPSGHEHASPGLVAEPPVVDAQVRHRGVHDLTASGVDRGQQREVATGESQSRHGVASRPGGAHEPVSDEPAPAPCHPGCRELAAPCTRASGPPVRRGGTTVLGLAGAATMYR